MIKVESRSCQWCGRDVFLLNLKHSVRNQEPSCSDNVECQNYIDREGVV